MHFSFTLAFARILEVLNHNCRILHRFESFLCILILGVMWGLRMEINKQRSTWSEPKAASNTRTNLHGAPCLSKRFSSSRKQSQCTVIQPLQPAAWSDCQACPQHVFILNPTRFVLGQPVHIPLAIYTFRFLVGSLLL